MLLQEVHENRKGMHRRCELRRTVGIVRIGSVHGAHGGTNQSQLSDVPAQGTVGCVLVTSFTITTLDPQR